METPTQGITITTFMDGIEMTDQIDVPLPTSTLPPYIPPFGTAPNITPFTYRDGVVYLERLEGIVRYINMVVVPWVQENYNQLAQDFTTEVNNLIDSVNQALAAQTADVDQKISDLTDYVNTEIANMQTYVDNAVQSIINSSVQVQDPVMAGIMQDSASQTRGVTDGLYVKKSEVTINASDFGIVGDGTTDISSTLQTLLNNNPGRVIYLPTGVYILGSPLTIGHGQTLRGDGQQDWRDRTAGFGDAGYANNANYNGTVIRYNGTTGTAITIVDTETGTGGIEKFTLIGPGSGTSTGVVIGSTTKSVVNPRIDRVKIANFSLGFTTMNVNEGFFLELMVCGCSTGVVLDQNTINNGFYSLDIQRCGNGVNILNSAWANSFYSFIAQSNSGYGVQVAGQSNVFYNPYFEANTGGCIIVLSGARGNTFDATMYGGSAGSLANAVVINSGALYTNLRANNSNPAAAINNAGTNTYIQGAMGTGQLTDTGVNTILIDAGTYGTAYAPSATISNPVLTGITLGNGTVTVRYTKVGKRCFCEIKITLGTTTVITGVVTVATGLSLQNIRTPVNAMMMNGTSGAMYQGMGHVTNTGLVSIGVMNLTDRSFSALSATVPFAMQANDSILAAFTSDTP